MSGYLRNQRRKGYPRGRRSLAQIDARVKAARAGLFIPGWHGTDSPLNDPRDSYPGRYA